MLQEDQHARSLQIPTRDTLVAAAIRQMARDLRAHEAASRPSPGTVVDGSEAVLRRRLGRSPTPAEIARTGGIEVEDVLAELCRRRRDRRT